MRNIPNTKGTIVKNRRDTLDEPLVPVNFFGLSDVEKDEPLEDPLKNVISERGCRGSKRRLMRNLDTSTISDPLEDPLKIVSSEEGCHGSKGDLMSDLDAITVSDPLEDPLKISDERYCCNKFDPGFYLDTIDINDPLEDPLKIVSSEDGYHGSKCDTGCNIDLITVSDDSNDSIIVIESCSGRKERSEQVNCRVTERLYSQSTDEQKSERGLKRLHQTVKKQTISSLKSCSKYKTPNSMKNSVELLKSSEHRLSSASDYKRKTPVKSFTVAQALVQDKLKKYGRQDHLDKSVNNNRFCKLAAKDFKHASNESMELNNESSFGLNMSLTNFKKTDNIEKYLNESLENKNKDISDDKTNGPLKYLDVEVKDRQMSNSSKLNVLSKRPSHNRLIASQKCTVSRQSSQASDYDRENPVEHNYKVPQALDLDVRKKYCKKDHLDKSVNNNNRLSKLNVENSQHSNNEPIELNNKSNFIKDCIKEKYYLDGSSENNNQDILHGKTNELLKYLQENYDVEMNYLQMPNSSKLNVSSKQQSRNRSAVCQKRTDSNRSAVSRKRTDTNRSRNRSTVCRKRTDSDSDRSENGSAENYFTDTSSVSSTETNLRNISDPFLNADNVENKFDIKVEEILMAAWKIQMDNLKGLKVKKTRCFCNSIYNKLVKRGFINTKHRSDYNASNPCCELRKIITSYKRI